VRSVPLQGSLTPLVYESDYEDRQKYPHGGQPEAADRVERHGPWKEEGDLEVEDDEEDRDEVIADVEAYPRVLERFESAFVCGQLLGSLLPLPNRKPSARRTMLNAPATTRKIRIGA
jgi:hypothetical protein